MKFFYESRHQNTENIPSSTTNVVEVADAPGEI